MTVMMALRPCGLEWTWAEAGEGFGGWLRLGRTGNGRGSELEIGAEVESDVGAGPGNGGRAGQSDAGDGQGSQGLVRSLPKGH